MLKLLMMGISTRHEPDEVISKQDPAGPVVLVQCLNNCLIGTHDGTVQAQRGDIIIWKQGTYRFMGTAIGSSVGFCNNWLFLHNDGIPEALEQYCVPENTLISDSNHTRTTDMFAELQSEYTLKLANRDEKIDMLIRMLLIQMGRQANARQSTLNLNANIEQLPRFKQIRSDIYAYPAADISINSIAADMGMSPGRFTQLYSAFFSTTPKYDMIQARLSLAKILLVMENEPLHSVARLSGFQNEYYFSRIFKKYVGCTPGVFRKKRGMV